MLRVYLKSSLGPLRITQAHVEGELGITVDSELLAAAHIMPGERARAWTERGGVFEVYVVPARRGSGTVSLTSAGRLGLEVGDMLRLTTECLLVDREALTHEPRVVEVDPGNKVRAPE